VKKKAAHRPLKYGEETHVVQIRVPKSKVGIFKKWAVKFLSRWEKNRKKPDDLEWDVYE
jgi:hypothetical protein